MANQGEFNVAAVKQVTERSHSAYEVAERSGSAPTARMPGLAIQHHCNQKKARKLRHRPLVEGRSLSRSCPDFRKRNIFLLNG